MTQHDQDVKRERERDRDPTGSRCEERDRKIIRYTYTAREIFGGNGIKKEEGETKRDQ